MSGGDFSCQKESYSKKRRDSKKEIKAKNKEDNFLFVPTLSQQQYYVQALVVLLHHHQGLSCPPTMSHKKMSFSALQENRFDYKAWLGAAKERNKKED